MILYIIVAWPQPVSIPKLPIVTAIIIITYKSSSFPLNKFKIVIYLRLCVWALYYCSALYNRTYHSLIASVLGQEEIFLCRKALATLALLMVAMFKMFFPCRVFITVYYRYLTEEALPYGES